MPWAEMLVTSTDEVVLPCSDEFIIVRFNRGPDGPELSRIKIVAPCNGDFRFQPEFGLPLSRDDMDVHPGFFSGEEKEPETTFAIYR